MNTGARGTDSGWSQVRRLRTGATLAALAASALLAVPAIASAASQPIDSVISSSPRGAELGLPNLDSRAQSPPARPDGATIAARTDLARKLGPQGVIESDRLTGTLRSVGRLDGFLTRPSHRPAAAVALGYVRAHRAAFGLDRADLQTFSLATSFADPDGNRHLSFVQKLGGVPVFGNGLKATVTADGRLVNLVGGPLHGAATRTTKPTLSAAHAVGIALADGGAADASPGAIASRTAGAAAETRFASGNRASLVLFPTSNGARLGWLVNAHATSFGDYIDVVDAANGKLLWRQNTVDFDGSGLAWEYYDTDLLPAGVGSQSTVGFPITGTGDALTGNNAHTYADPKDTIQVPGGTVPNSAEIPATTTGANPNWNYPVTADTSDFFRNCSTDIACTWDSFAANSWQTNLEQNATQVYHYVNNFHDHLMNDPDIGFTSAAGNFQVSNSGLGGKGHDAVQAQVDDGANTSTSLAGSTCPVSQNNCGFPDSHHIVNANMATQQDGIPPRMQMYLFPAGFLNSGAPDANGGDDASVIYHEYTHGLSSRLVTFPDGVPSLVGFQAGSMGEAWSDWYAMDFLVAQGYDADTSAIGDVQVGFFVGGGTTVPLRSEPMDCPADGSSHSGVCPGGTSTGPGGYTYGDMGKIIGQPEVHADGEIWGQTIWQIHQQLGSNVAEKLITEAMELSPPNPSMLDMRNAILQADQVTFGGSHQNTLWQVFANRGMGFFATTDGTNDPTPVEDFSLPPSCPAQCTTVSGKIRDIDTDAGVQGARVGIQAHNSGLGNDLADNTNATGHYSIDNVPTSHSYNLEIGKAGYEPVTLPISVGTGPLKVNRKIRRDWAAIAGGASVTSFTPPDYSAFGCGPEQGFDTSQATGWGSDSPTNGSSGTTGPRSVTLQLPVPVNITQLQIDPGATCGDPDSAGVQEFTVKTRAVAASGFVTAWHNTAALPEHVYSARKPRKGNLNVDTIKLTMSSNRGNASFMDMSELLVHGVPPA
jgi:extracellular elastinolytic metalloproteinase